MSDARRTEDPTPEVSVIVPVRNDARRLAELLARLARQTAPPSVFEVLVVDDASTDETPEIVSSASGVRVIRSPARRGSYHARNLGIAEARGAALAFTDSDCSPALDWVERGLTRIAGGAGRVAGRIDVPLGYAPSTAAVLDAAAHLDQCRYVRDGFAATANLWVTRELIDRIGPFNAELASGGDKEFGLRAVRAGVAIEYDPDLVVAHPPRAHLRELARKSFRLGSGAATHNYKATGPLAERDATWSHLRSYLPAGQPPVGPAELMSSGIEPRWLRVRRLYWAHYLSMRLPYALGGLAVALREERLGALRRLLLERHG